MNDVEKSYLTEVRSHLCDANRALCRISIAMSPLWALLDASPVIVPSPKPIDHTFYWKDTSRDSTALFYKASRGASSAMLKNAHDRGFDTLEALSKEYNMTAAFIWATLKLQPEAKGVSFHSSLILVNKKRMMELVKERGLSMTKNSMTKRLGTLINDVPTQ